VPVSKKNMIAPEPVAYSGMIDTLRTRKLTKKTETARTAREPAVL
jgi:hypothetical protein